MSALASASPFKGRGRVPWQRSLLDSALALMGSMLVTGLIVVFQLYPRIPNISIIYLLVILPLASTRGRYAATIASLVAFLSFDFFLVPPFYSLVIYRAEEWIALLIFLAAALLTGNLAAALRQSAREALRRERETRALYQLVQSVSSEEAPEGQLRAICRAVVAVFAPLGVRECEILAAEAGPFATSEHVLPLTLAGKAVGALRLSLENTHASLLDRERQQEQDPSARGTSFLWTFLSQVAALLERARLQQDNLNMAILQRTDVLRKALLSSVSHDLRTPLTAIKAAASSLLQEDVRWSRETRRDFLQSIEREANRLNRLVENLLDMSRIEEGALVPEKDWYSLKALIQDVTSRLKPFLQGRSIQKQIPDDLLMVEMDYLEIDQVLTNLLENVVRHTPIASPIEIRADRVGQEVLFSVADRGPGLSPAHLAHIFDKFYRVLHQPDAPASPGSPTGSGLGLAVCKGLVEAHGGRIWAEPREGGGLMVSVALPAGEPERIPV